MISLDGLRFDGVAWRYIPAWGHPLHAGFLLLAAGRWNRYGQYGCLYTALSREGAIAEYEKAREHTWLAADDDEKRDVVSILVRVEPVLDLTRRLVRRAFRVSLAPLTGDTEDCLERCHALADRARGEGYRAILSPSAALRGGTNLNIYLEGRAADLRLREGSHREPLNY